MRTVSFIYGGSSLPSYLKELKGEILVQIYDGCGDISLINKLVLELKKVFDKPMIIGTSTPLSISNGKFYTTEVNVTITCFEKTRLTLSLVEDISKFKQTIYESLESDTKGCLIYSSRHTHLEILSEDFRTFSSLFFFGSLGGFTPSGDYVIYEGKYLSNVILVVTFSGEIEFHQSTIESYFGVGRNEPITRISGNRIYEIGNKTVLDYYKKLFNVDDELAKKTMNYFPLLCSKVKHSQIEVLEVYDDGSIEIPFKLGLGDSLRVSVANMDLFEPQFVNAVKQFSEVPVDDFFIYSSIPHFNYIKYLNDDELVRIAKEVGINGVYGKVDIGFLDNQSLFTTGTTVIVSMSESGKVRKFDYKPLGEAEFDNLNQKFMLKLLTRVSKDFDNVNDLMNASNSIPSSHYLMNVGMYDEATGLPNLQQMVKDIHKNASNFNISVSKFKNESFLRDIYGDLFIDECKKKLVTEILKEYDASVKLYSLVEGLASVSILEKEDHKRLMDEIYQKFFKYGYSFKNEIIDFDFAYATVFKGSKNPLIKVKRALYETIERGRHYREYGETQASLFEVKEGFDQYRLVSEAYRNESFKVFYQGIYSVSEKKINHFESLIRIERDGKIYSPYYFIDIAYKFGYSRYITMYCMEQAFKNVVKYDCNISINLRLTDLEDDDLFSHFVYLLSKYGHASNILVEILENEEIITNTVSLRRLKDLKNMGLRIAVDDFGAGYSNFDYYQQGVFDIIKISGNLTRNIMSSDMIMLDMIKTIIKTSHRFGMKVVVEYCESKECAKLLEEIGADYIQGFYFSEPNPEIKLKDYNK